MIDLLRQVGGALVWFLLVSIVLVYLGTQFPAVKPTVSTLIVGLCIVAPGIGIVLHYLDLL